MNAAFLGSYSVPLFHYLPSTSGISWPPRPIGAPCYLALHLFPASLPTPFVPHLSLLIRPDSLTEPAYSRLQSLLTLLLDLRVHPPHFFPH